MAAPEQIQTKRKLIGRGSFTKTYLLNDGMVELESTDMVKECMSFGWFPESRFFPDIERIHYGDNYSTYRMEYFPKHRALSKVLSPADWGLYKALRGLTFDFLNGDWKCIESMRKAFATLPDEELVEALNGAVDGCLNYGSSVRFEISPRNVAVTGQGALILLDCFFFADALKQLNKR